MDDTSFAQQALTIGLAAVAMLFFTMMLHKSWEQIRATRIGVEKLNHTLNEYLARISVAENQIETINRDQKRLMELDTSVHEISKRIAIMEERFIASEKTAALSRTRLINTFKTWVSDHKAEHKIVDERARELEIEIQSKT